MSNLDRIEEHRDLVAGLEYEDHWNDFLEQADEKLAWKRRVLDRDAACLVWHEYECEGDLQAHHVVTQQHLRKRGLHHVLWNRRIGVTVCERAHRRHHAATERIPLDVLPEEVVAFVRELGLDWYLDRYYGSSPRPESLSPPSDGSGHPRRARLRERTIANSKRFLH